MGIKRMNVSAETKAELRRSWIQTILIIFAAFAVLFIISLFSDAETPTCEPPAFLCTQPEVERWIGVDLPLSAEDVNFESNAEANTLWLAYRAAPLEMAHFLSRMALVVQTETPGEIPINHPDWWQVDEVFIPYVLSESGSRDVRVWVDEAAADEWTLYLYGHTLPDM
jgi:hypothetical protein